MEGRTTSMKDVSYWSPLRDESREQGVKMKTESEQTMQNGALLAAVLHGFQLEKTRTMAVAQLHI